MNNVLYTTYLQIVDDPVSVFVLVQERYSGTSPSHSAKKMFRVPSCEIRITVSVDSAMSRPGKIRI